ncbi:hypothetical protein GCK32_010094 [Trichostrongylus colubriformis]|uniref:Uncharacterized protein n=1 Tax=Trichostrongylus colubriformis TaxID=6319 RepID=A0AAN8IDC1_TRICO
MLIVDGIILMIITWYVEAVYPGGEGVPQKPWFFLLKSYWFPYSQGKKSAASQAVRDAPPVNREFVKLEKEPNLKVNRDLL